MKTFHQSKSLEWLEGITSAREPAAFTLRLEQLEVGILRKQNGTWLFSYSPEFRAQTEIYPIINFPNVNREYRSSTLWPFFLVRIPSLKQPAVQRFLQQRQAKSVDEVTLLREFGRRAIANPFELVPE
jgi:HipA-like protein